MLRMLLAQSGNVSPQVVANMSEQQLREIVDMLQTSNQGWRGGGGYGDASTGSGYTPGIFVVAWLCVCRMACGDLVLLFFQQTHRHTCAFCDTITHLLFSKQRHTHAHSTPHTPTTSCPPVCPLNPDTRVGGSNMTSGLHCAPWWSDNRALHYRNNRAPHQPYH